MRNIVHVTRLAINSAASQRRNLILFLIMCGALALELWLIRTWYPLGWISFLQFSIQLGALILLLLVAIGCFFRMPMGRRRLAVLYLIRPVLCVKGEPDYNPAAVAAALQRELKDWPIAAHPMGIHDGSAPSVTIKNLTVPLDWLWNGVKRILTGRVPIIIEAMLFDTDRPLELVAWSGTHIVTDTIDENLPFNAALRTALVSITLSLIAHLQPEFYADIEWSLENYDKAIEVYKKRPATIARDLALARLLICIHQEGLAREQLHAIANDYLWLSPKQRMTMEHLHATIDANTGNYASARARAEELLDKRPWITNLERRELDRQLWLSIAACERDMGRFAESWTAYEKAEEIAFDELRRVTGLRGTSDREAILLRARVRPPTAVDVALTALHETISEKATLLRLQGKNPRGEYRRQLQVLETRRQLADDQATLASIVMDIAQVTAFDAYAAAEPDCESLLSRLKDANRFKDAKKFYELAINLRPDDGPFSDRDFAGRTALAWCECGKLQCGRAVLELSPWPSLAAGVEEGVELVLRLVEWLDENSRQAFSVQWSQSLPESSENDADRERFLANVATTLSKALLNPSAEEATRALNEIRWLLQNVGVQPDDNTSIGSGNSIATQVRMTKAQLRSKSASKDILSLVRFVQTGGDTEILGLVEQKVTQRNEEQTIYSECLERIKSVGDSPYHLAECSYLNACIFAILSNGLSYIDTYYVSDAVTCLKEAIECSQMDGSPSVFLGRARIDRDFDHIRQHPLIQEALASPVNPS